MKKLISAKLAGTILLFLMFFLAIFHFLILFKVIPADMVWGGQIQDSSTNVLLMEIIALIVTIAFMLIIAVKISKFDKYRRLINVGTWVIFIFLILNTFGNFASEHLIEKIVFAPTTIFMAFLCLRLAIEK
ncbi:MAG: hypothetical protein K8S16_11160 [Bacteroidales bacterium]|nr:hypothetical protein [Bacteroidales bacterium]